MYLKKKQLGVLSSHWEIQPSEYLFKGHHSLMGDVVQVLLSS